MDKKDMVLLDERTIKDMVYEIRDQKVMFDFDLARIYGYSTKAFNRQVNNNKDRFPKDFHFRISSQEIETILRCKNCTTKPLSSKRRYNPHVFTEQGIYMLMTVLKGELAVKQSITLIKLFKAMKDALSQGASLIEPQEIIGRLESHESRLKAVESQLGEVMSLFTEPAPMKEWLIMDGERIEADIAYHQIYSRAKRNVIIIDDYIGLKTLRLLKVCNQNVFITIYTDNVARPPLEQGDIDDFVTDTGLSIETKPTNNRIHDRYIFVDYGHSEESLFLCGSSSKDAGGKTTTIMRAERPKDFHRMLDELK